jgi:hypothetical protein
MTGKSLASIKAFQFLAIMLSLSAGCFLSRVESAAAESEKTTGDVFRAVTFYPKNSPADWLKDPKPSPYVQIDYSPDGNYATQTGNLRLELASVHTKSLLWSFPPTGNQVWGMSWANDSKRMVVSDEKGVFILDADSGRLLSVYQGLTGRVFSPQWSPDGKYIAAIGPKAKGKEAQERNALEIWDANSQKTVFQFTEFPGTVVRWSPDSTRIAFNGRDHTVQIWNIIDKKRLAKISVPERGLPPLAWSPDGKYIAVGDSMTAEVTIYDAADGAAVTVHKFKALESISWSRDGKSILSLSGEPPSTWNLSFESGKIKKVPIKVKVLGELGYIPKNLDECYAQLNAQLKPADIKKLKEGSESDLAQYHMGLGMYMRNTWGLWGGSELAQSLRKMGIRHPDDMSGVILTSYWRKLNGRPVDLDGQIAESERYWRQAQIEQEKSQQKAKTSSLEVTKRMLGLQFVQPEALPTLEIPPLVGAELRTRYADNFDGHIIITAKKFGKGDEITTPPYVVDLAKAVVLPMEIAELDTIEDAVVCKTALYVNGVRHGQQAIVEFKSGKHKVMTAPTGEGWLRLGIGKSQLLAVRQHSVFVLQEDAWKKLVSTPFALPKCTVPVEMTDQRIYFRDEGRYEDDKRLSWIDLSAPETLHYFDEDCGLVGPEGPRWEFVNSYTPEANGKLWICAGMFSQSLLEWSKDEGYKIAVINNRLTFDGKHLLGTSNNMEGYADQDIAITCVLNDGNNRLLCFGPTGLYRLDGNKLTQMLRFTNGVQANKIDGSVCHTTWIPTHIIKCGGDDYFIGSHWGGTLRLKRNAAGAFGFELLDRKLGAPTRF